MCFWSIVFVVVYLFSIVSFVFTVVVAVRTYFRSVSRAVTKHFYMLTAAVCLLLNGVFDVGTCCTRCCNIWVLRRQLVLHSEAQIRLFNRQTTTTTHNRTSTWAINAEVRETNKTTSGFKYNRSLHACQKWNSKIVCFCSPPPSPSPR